LAQVYHLRPLFILDRIYTLLHTGCSPGAMFSRCAPCLFQQNLLKEESRLKKQTDGITKYLNIVSALLDEIIIKEKPYKCCEEEINAVADKII
jgi:hypothetical protein